MTIPYSVGFPVNKDSLGSTRSKFFTNTQSISDIIAVNHYTFGDAGGAGFDGNHKFVVYQRQVNNFPTTVDKQIATYGAQDTNTTLTQIWFQPQNQVSGAGSIQLTAGDVTDTKFGVNIAYPSAVAGATMLGGWTFLPGNLLLQYGLMNLTGVVSAVSYTVNFPISFRNAPFSIQTTLNSHNSVLPTFSASSQTVTVSSFNYKTSGAQISGNVDIMFIAIGPA